MQVQHHHIIISTEAFGYGFDVEVRPIQAEVGHDRHFVNLAEARRYAAQLAAAMHWSVHDLTGEDAG